MSQEAPKKALIHSTSWQTSGFGLTLSWTWFPSLKCKWSFPNSTPLASFHSWVSKTPTWSERFMSMRQSFSSTYPPFTFSVPGLGYFTFGLTLTLSHLKQDQTRWITWVSLNHRDLPISLRRFRLLTFKSRSTRLWGLQTAFASPKHSLGELALTKHNPPKTVGMSITHPTDSLKIKGARKWVSKRQERNGP